ncbi:gfo/Idh/MocA family oxidoreductase [Ornithinibacillus sp. L9]|uniref:Gfo/Idh/MocA family oxidoreductase n=1 Tax=Ornithinibacillus caprae TaxID=2678566 RepID=A0A6N8FDW5_9BACI|nr:Gfo/Idh/MocA family oxidoreductase [Ornithinibacillus caprae]MUK87720.1 gfo/Idh/MocA family oxidoreductase [Ornithinibacillus caprae]
MEKVRWGVLSTAGIAQKALLPAFDRAENAEVVGIATRSGMGKAEAVAKKFAIEKTYDRYEKLLDDPTIDAVYIPLPNHLHKKWVMEAARRGKHILCEKPAALTAEEVLEMKTVCEENNVIFMEGFMYHFHPQHERVKEIVDAGEIGEVKYMRAGFTFYLGQKDGNIRMSDQKGGGSIYDIGCYAIHSIRNILRQEPTSVFVDAIKDAEYGVDTDAVGYLTFDGGVRATFDSSFGLYNRTEYEVFGTEGSIRVPRAYRPDKNGGEGMILVEKAGVTRTETVTGDQYREQVEHISNAILTGDHKLKHDLNNTIHNMRVIDACFKSIDSGKKVTID